MNDALQTISTRDLAIGMFIILPGSWFKHPFLANEFAISSQEEIDRILDYGVQEIVIDTSRSLPPASVDTAVRPSEGCTSAPPKTWTPEKLIPTELREAIRSKTLPPEKKSKIVYESSRVLIERLFEDPKAENIREAKKGIAEVTDMILSDNATAKELLKITSYDSYTYTHSLNVGVLSLMLAKHLLRGSDAHDMHELGAGFFLHDIGKVRIDPAIINKPGKLTDEEMAKIRTHPSEGCKILAEAKQLTGECKVIVMQHHEREDGTGYPLQLKSNEIHTYGRICSIADVYDALTAERSYKQKLDPFDALKLMREQLLSHFHKEMFVRFVLMFTNDSGYRYGRSAPAYA